MALINGYSKWCEITLGVASLWTRSIRCCESMPHNLLHLWVKPKCFSKLRVKGQKKTLLKSIENMLFNKSSFMEGIHCRNTPKLFEPKIWATGQLFNEESVLDCGEASAATMENNGTLNRCFSTHPVIVVIRQLDHLSLRYWWFGKKNMRIYINSKLPVSRSSTFYIKNLRSICIVLLASP